MFESIQDKLNGVFRSLTGKAKISEDNVAEAVREVRVALLDADVNIDVARAFVGRVKEQALGEKVLAAVDPSEQFVKIIHDELVALLGGEHEEIQWRRGEPTVLMLCGLQGAGKTTTAGKLALKFKQQKRQPLLVAADVQRPAAIEQLRVLGGQIDVPVHAQEGGDPVAICRQALEIAKVQGADTVILDTAGRLHVDEALMHELEQIAAGTNPAEILFICDAMIGQSAVETAAEFKKRLPLSGAVMTKLDSDARGGAALSLREVTGVPLKYVTVGEKLDAIEEFHPERMAGRILGMGDVVSLVEKAQSVVDEKDAEAMRRKLEQNAFTLDDFQKQLAQLRKMGSMKDLLGLIPGLGGALRNIDIDEREFKQIEVLIQSMTPEERKHPELIEQNVGRQRRISRGAGRIDANGGKPLLRPLRDLLKQFTQMRKMIGGMSKAGMFSGGMEALQGLGDMGSMLGGGADPAQLQGILGGGSKKQKSRSQQQKKKRKDRKRKKRRK